ncbi:MAG: four-carbon acid sugar kinase family protein [Armatimonadetes bacterium]|nr:four-carbon acid sugar kinase family protein [Armatimonadota bacterium]
MRWAIVADDLTGAADAAVVFADRGIETTVWLCEPEEFPDGTCCSVDTNSRWQDAESAAKAVRKHVRKLQNTDWLMLKIDSTLRGFVGAMVQAAWQSSKRKWALIAPSVPKQGRKVVNGKLFVHEQLVTELDLAKEQPAPITTPSVSERLRETGLDKFPLEHLNIEVVRHSNRLAQTIEWATTKGIGLICDAETDKDLERIVSAAVKSSTQPLFVGASGLAKALAKVTEKPKIEATLRIGILPDRVRRVRESALRDRGKIRRCIISTIQMRPSKILVIVGSQQTLARKQLGFLAAKGVPVTEMSDLNLSNLPDAKVSAVLLKPDNFLLKFALQTQKHSLAGACFQLLSAELLRRFDALIIVGGLTARTIFDLLDVKRWDLMGSLISGMPFGIVHLRNRKLLVATKAGGFGTRQTLWRAVVALNEISAE